MKIERQIERSDLIQVEPEVWEIPNSFNVNMRVPARLYADEALLQASLLDRSVEQLVNTATLPGVVKYAIAMPDIHQGYGFPIGGVIATRLPDGVISPGGVGYDINCGVRVLASEANFEEVQLNSCGYRLDRGGIRPLVSTGSVGKLPSQSRPSAFS
jgi:tRNA-splicing ligase RtcB